MQTRTLLLMVLSAFVLMRCAVATPAPTAEPVGPATPQPTASPSASTAITPSPSPSTTPVVTVSPSPEATPAAATTVSPSKYDGVYVQTIEEKANEERSLLHVAYPVTEQDAINARMATIAEGFIEEYHTIAAQQEAAYQDYVEETGEEAASFVTQYVQHFDVTLADANLISLAIEQYRFTGGTGSTVVTGYIFDRVSGEELSPHDLFVDDAYLARLSTFSREALTELVRTQMADMAFDSDTAREDWWNLRLGMITDGTEPQPENFDGLTFRDDGTIHLLFDKYQVGPGSDGVIEIEVPAELLADLLVPEMQQLLGVAPPEPLPTVTPAAAAPQATQPAGPVDCSAVPCVALTFDDGPSVYTDGLLDTLAARNARATFFVLGKSARVQPETVLRIVQEGHDIGNHSWSHRKMVGLTDEEMDAEISQTNALVTETTGRAPAHFRPPYGVYDPPFLTHVGMPVILWTLDPLDWKDRDAAIVAERIDAATAGMIILAHDIHETTVAAIPNVVDDLMARGIHFVTVSELIGPPGPVAGVVYQRGATPQ